MHVIYGNCKALLVKTQIKWCVCVWVRKSVRSICLLKMYGTLFDGKTVKWVVFLEINTSPHIKFIFKLDPHHINQLFGFRVLFISLLNRPCRVATFEIGEKNTRTKTEKREMKRERKWLIKNHNRKWKTFAQPFDVY